MARRQRQMCIRDSIITSQTIFNEYIDRQKKQLKQLAAKVVMGDTDESI